MASLVPSLPVSAMPPGAGVEVADRPSNPNRYTGRRKAAILLASLGDEVGAALLSQLTEEEAFELSYELSLLSKCSDEEQTAVLNEFLARAENPISTRGGPDFAASVLVKAFGPTTGKRIADRLLKPDTGDSSTLDALRKADPDQLAKVVNGEHPQTIALILCYLETKGAARLLNALPPKLRPDVVRRMASLEQISPEIIGRIAKVIGSKLTVFDESKLESYGGIRAIAEVLAEVESSTTDEILETIATDDPALGEEIRNSMFTFGDLINLSKQSITDLVNKIDRKVLTMALKGSSVELKKHFTSVMSGRAAEMFEEDMQALGPVRIKDVKIAQQEILGTARKLQAEGTISLNPNGGGDEFVE